MQVNYFHPLTFGMTVSLLAEKFYRVKSNQSKPLGLIDEKLSWKAHIHEISKNVSSGI